MARGEGPQPIGDILDELIEQLGSDTIDDDADVREDEADLMALGLIIARHENPGEWLLAVAIGLALAIEIPEARVYEIVREGYRRNRLH